MIVDLTLPAVPAVPAVPVVPAVPTMLAFCTQRGESFHYTRIFMNHDYERAGPEGGKKRIFIQS